jgi:tetratricopeptide (TPR) repeat protein
MAQCPSCGGSLDAEGICGACGALSRGFFRGLDLGRPQIAAAVTRGLDFYKLLEVAPDADTHTIARRYRRLRVLFPDDSRRLAPEPARRLELLEVAGRVLTDPPLRQIYDQLRSGEISKLELGVLRCIGCGAPFEQQAVHCQYCGTARPAAAQAPVAPPTADPPPTDPVDYYALIGLTAEHLGLSQQAAQIRRGGERYSRDGHSQAQFVRPPTPEEVDAAAYERQRTALISAGGDPGERERRFNELEIARRILRDERRRPQYDALLQAFGKGLIDRGRIETLHHLQETILAEMQAEQAQPNAPAEEGLLRQAEGYLSAGLAREALSLLRKALAVSNPLPQAHQLFVQAALASDDPLSLGGHVLRQILRSLAASNSAETQPDPALNALCQGLLAREEGRVAEAEVHLYAAVSQNPQLSAGWRALAALALGRSEHDRAISHARRATHADPQDERAMLLIAAACIQTRRREEARTVAAQIARIRGYNAQVDAQVNEILQEVGG